MAIPRWCRAHPDALLTLAAFVIMTSTVGAGDGGWQGPTSGQLTLLLLAWVPLTVRTAWPLPVLAVVAGLDTLRIAASSDGAKLVPVATMLAIFTVSSRYPPRRSWALGAATALLQFLASAASHSYVGSDLLFLNWALVATAIGHLVRERRTAVQAAEQRAVTAERMRIAHELHDVLAHHVTLVNAQAGVAQYLLRTDPEAADTALAGIVANSRAALDELRAALGLLRSEPGDAPRSPTPTAEQLDTLVDGFMATGMRIEVDTHGTPRPLTGTADLALYRIAQEALTNASKHAAGGPVHLDIAWSADLVRLTVTSAAPAGTRGLPTAGTGHGLLGMRERAGSAGGTFTSSPTADGGYVVTATLPVGN